MASAKRRKRGKIPWKTLLYGVLIGVGSIVLLILLLTLMIYLGWLPETAASIGNTVIKIIAALAAGTYIGFARERSPWWFGGIAAVLALTLMIAGMSVYLGEFSPSWTLLADLLMCFAIGSAATALFLRRKTE